MFGVHCPLAISLMLSFRSLLPNFLYCTILKYRGAKYGGKIFSVSNSVSRYEVLLFFRPQFRMFHFSDNAVI